jgi:hypothetical protein
MVDRAQSPTADVVEDEALVTEAEKRPSAVDLAPAHEVAEVSVKLWWRDQALSTANRSLSRPPLPHACDPPPCASMQPVSCGQTERYSLLKRVGLEGQGVVRRGFLLQSTN